jgi:hypothetical protein
MILQTYIISITQCLTLLTVKNPSAIMVNIPLVNLQPLTCIGSINTEHCVQHMRVPQYFIDQLYDLASVQKRPLGGETTFNYHIAKDNPSKFDTSLWLNEDDPNVKRSMATNDPKDCVGNRL